jgi:hypothetical protein
LYVCFAFENICVHVLLVFSPCISRDCSGSADISARIARDNFQGQDILPDNAGLFRIISAK